MSKSRINHPLYGVWQSMKQRCTNENNHSWAHYGGRGIKVCDRWLDSFDYFREDVGERPFEGAQLDRIDNNGDYKPGNTRWVTAAENMSNRRDPAEWRAFYAGNNNCRSFSIRLDKDVMNELRDVCDKDCRSVNFIVNRGLRIALDLFAARKLKPNWDYEIPK